MAPGRSQLRRRLSVGVVLLGLALPAGLWIAVNRVEWLGPLVADGLRAVVGVTAVTELENFAYSVEDSVNRMLRSGEVPRARWALPQRSAAGPLPSPPATVGVDAGASRGKIPVDGGVPAPPPLALPDVGPVHSSWFAPGDGVWLEIALPDLPGMATPLRKTLLHPDKNRSWAELFVVAIDLDRASVHLVPGTREPQGTEPEAEGLPRPGRIPDSDHSRVLAAFNGGFKTEHGGYGMGLDGVTWAAPKAGVCVVAGLPNGRVIVDGWDDVAARVHEFAWWRQTPNCMAEDGVVHPRLRDGFTKKWGATLDGNTVIRRSAVGVGREGRVLYVAISNHTTARALVDGMLHAGAQTVAQLDVNFSYPKFVLFERDAAGATRKAVALADGFEFSDDEYIRKRSVRDFFYLTPAERP